MQVAWGAGGEGGAVMDVDCIIGVSQVPQEPRVKLSTPGKQWHWYPWPSPPGQHGWPICTSLERAVNCVICSHSPVPWMGSTGCVLSEPGLGGEGYLRQSRD